MNRQNNLYKVAWLVGSSGGIGRRMGLVLDGMCAVTCRVDRVTIPPDADDADGRRRLWEVDAADEHAFGRFSRDATEAWGPPEALVVAAGYVESRTLEDSLPSSFDKIYRDNVRLAMVSLQGFFLACELTPAVPKTVVVVSSNAGLLARPNQAAYAASKAAVLSLVRSVALGWARYNIRVNAIAPGTVWVDRNDPEIRERLTAPPLDPDRPLGRVAVPDDLDATLTLLLQPGNLITGQVIVVDAGSSLRERIQ